MRLSIKAITLILVIILAVIYGVYSAIGYQDFKKQITGIKGVKIGDSRAEIKYRLGIPTNVEGPLIIWDELKDGPSPSGSPTNRHFSRVYTVSMKPGSANGMPEGKTIDDFDGWQYEDRENIRLIIRFNSLAKVEAIELYSKVSTAPGWSVAGIRSGDSEEDVLKLGTPSKQELDNLTKTIHFDKLGITVWLTKGTVYMIRLEGVR